QASRLNPGRDPPRQTTACPGRCSAPTCPGQPPRRSAARLRLPVPSGPLPASLDRGSQQTQLPLDTPVEVLNPAVVVLMDIRAVVIQVLAVLVVDAIRGLAVVDVHNGLVTAQIQRTEDLPGLRHLHVPAQRRTGAHDRLAD